MSRPASAEMHAIDIEVAYQRLLHTSPSVVHDEVIRSEAYADLGGLSTTRNSSAEPTVFMEFAKILREEKTDDEGQKYKKYDIARGLGGLGLIAVDLPDIMAMRKSDIRSYALALGDYQYAIEHRSRVLATVGCIDSDAFQARYPHTDQTWASTYAVQLSSLKQTLSSTELFAYTQGLIGPRTNHEKAAGLTKGWELHTDGNGRFAVYKPASRTRRAA